MHSFPEEDHLGQWLSWTREIQDLLPRAIKQLWSTHGSEAVTNRFAQAGLFTSSNRLSASCHLHHIS